MQDPGATRTSMSRNVLWNLAGELAPVLAALVSIPLLIHFLGTSRFGILSLIWALLGYLNLFDVGIGRALTKLAADRFGAREDSDIGALFWTAFVMMLTLSIAAGVGLSFAARWLVYKALAIPTSMQAETLWAVYLLSFSLPLVITSSAFRGMLAALLRFDLLNAVRIPLGVSVFASPLLVLPFSRSLVAVAAVLVLMRLLGWLAYLRVCWSAAPQIAAFERPRLDIVKDLLSFGGWVTVSSVVLPLTLYSDRFFIGARLSAAAVAYYATPCDVVLRFSTVPTAVAGVLFPAFARSLGQQASERTTELLRRGTNLIFVAMFPTALTTVVLAPVGLSLWLGHDFSAHSASVMQWLTVGIFVNCLGHLPYAAIQAAHRPDIIAKLSLIELPLYLLLMYFLLRRRGLEGVAIAWSFRMAIDVLALWLATLMVAPETRGIAAKNLQLMLGGLAVIAIGLFLPRILALEILFLAVSLIGFGLIAWFFLLVADERRKVSVSLRSLYRLPA